MAEYDFSGVDKIAQPQQQTTTQTPHDPSNGFDFSGVDKSNDQAGTLGLVKTVAEQGLSGLTGGLSKVIQTKSGLSTPEDIAQRAELHPVAAPLANLGGTGALLWATGGLGAAAEGVGLAGEAASAAEVGTSTPGLLGAAGNLSAAGRIGTSAVEGAGLGAVNQASDDWSNNRPLDAQKIAASAGLGAVLGGGITGSLEGLSALGGKVSSKISAFNDTIKKLDIDPNSESIGDSFRRGYQSTLGTGEDVSKYVNNVVGSLKDLKDAAKDSVKGMYDSYKMNLGHALEDLPLPKAQSAAQDVVDNINGKLGALNEAGETTSQLPKALDERVETKLDDLKSNLEKSQNAAEVHENLRNFATDLDKEIKFAGGVSPTAAADQELLRGIRQTVRSNLGDSSVWGEEAAGHYTDVTENYGKFVNAQKQFDKDFAKARVSSNGQRSYEIDPSKVKSFLKNIDDPSQNLRNMSLDQFTQAARVNAQTAADHEAFTEGMLQLQKKIENLGSQHIDAAKKIAIVNGLKSIREGHTGVATWLALEHLPVALKYPALVLRRYATQGGAGRIGGDLAKTLDVTQKLTKHITQVDRNIENGIKAIFYTGARKITSPK